jgi:hypothetical protein
VSRLVGSEMCIRDSTGAEFLGQPPTGNKVSVDGVSIDTIKGGIVLDGFDAWDSLGFRQQLGILPKD